MSEEKRPTAYPWPRMCSTCWTRTVVQAEIVHTAEITDGEKTHSVYIPALKVGKCTTCGDVVFDLVTDDQINAAFRHQTEQRSDV